MKRCKRRSLGLLVFFVSLLAFRLVLAEDFPAFKKGQWQYDRTVATAGGQPMSMQMAKCSDPTAEMKASNAQFASFCKMTPLTKAGNVYTYGADCTTPGGRSVSKSELTATSDTEYSIKVNTDTGGVAVKEELKAKRIGDCQ